MYPSVVDRAGTYGYRVSTLWHQSDVTETGRVVAC
jgi:hypothetical protein